MEKSEQIARALESMFRCFSCGEWKPEAEVGRDVRWDAQIVAGVECLACVSDPDESVQWPAREVA